MQDAWNAAGKQKEEVPRYQDKIRIIITWKKNHEEQQQNNMKQWKVLLYFFKNTNKPWDRLAVTKSISMKSVTVPFYSR